MFRFGKAPIGEERRSLHLLVEFSRRMAAGQSTRQARFPGRRGLANFSMQKPPPLKPGVLSSDWEASTGWRVGRTTFGPKADPFLQNLLASSTWSRLICVAIKILLNDPLFISLKMVDQRVETDC